MHHHNDFYSHNQNLQKLYQAFIDEVILCNCLIIGLIMGLKRKVNNGIFTILTNVLEYFRDNSHY